MSDARWTWVELSFTVVIPVIALTFGSSWTTPQIALAVGLAFPFLFALASMVRDGRPSALSALALVSVTLTGGIGLLELEPRWFAVKEAAVPAGFGALVAASAPTRLAVVPVLLDRLLDPERTRAALDRSGGQPLFERAARRGTVELGAVTAASAVGSWLLATYLVTSPPGTEAFTAELGRYTGWSFPAVTVPSMILSVVVLRRVLARLEAAAGVPFEELLRPAAR